MHTKKVKMKGKTDDKFASKSHVKVQVHDKIGQIACK